MPKRENKEDGDVTQKKRTKRQAKSSTSKHGAKNKRTSDLLDTAVNEVQLTSGNVAVATESSAQEMITADSLTSCNTLEQPDECRQVPHIYEQTSQSTHLTGSDVHKTLGESEAYANKKSLSLGCMPYPTIDAGHQEPLQEKLLCELTPGSPVEKAVEKHQEEQSKRSSQKSCLKVESSTSRDKQPPEQEDKVESNKHDTLHQACNAKEHKNTPGQPDQKLCLEKTTSSTKEDLLRQLKESLYFSFGSDIPDRFYCVYDESGLLSRAWKELLSPTQCKTMKERFEKDRPYASHGFLNVYIRRTLLAASKASLSPQK